MIEAAFRANANNSPFQQIPAFSLTEVQFPIEEFDTGNLFANSRFTCSPAFNGKYLCLSGCVGMSSGNPGGDQTPLECQIERSTDNGSSWTIVANQVVVETNYANVNSGPMLLATGDTYRIRVFCSGGSMGDSNVWFDPGVSYFSGYILSGIEVFRAINTTVDDDSSNSELPLPTVLFDTAGAFASNRFTVPSGWDGKYLHLTGGCRFKPTPFYSEVALQRSIDAGANFDTIAGGGGEGTKSITCASGPVLLTSGHVFRAITLCYGGIPEIDASEAEEAIFLSGWVDLI